MDALKIEYIEPCKLKPHPRNPNKHPQEQIDLLKKMISITGFRNPVIVSKRSGYIVAGHGRTLAAIASNIEEIPVIYEDFKDEAEEAAFIIGDNMVSELANMEKKEVMDIISEFDDGCLDLALFGMPDFKLEELMTSAADVPENLPTLKEPMFTCPACGHQFS